MKCALVGCGRISKKHFDAMNKNGIEIVGVCDCIESRAVEAAKQYGIEYFTDYKKLNKIDFDLLSVCTYPSEHTKIAINAMINGHSVLVEKPASLRIDEANKMIHCSGANNVKIFEVRQNRYNKAMQILKRCIDNSKFGEIHFATVRLYWCRHQEYFEQDPFKWRGTWKHDGGVFASQGCHHVDAMSWLLGGVKSVQANGFRTVLDIECEDTGTATIEFKNGCLGFIYATNAMRPENIEATITVTGDNGTVIVSGTHLNKITYYNLDGESWCKEKLDGFNECNNDIYGNGHSKIYSELKSYFSGNHKANVINGKEILKSIELVNAIYKSMEVGYKVYFNEQQNSIVSEKLGI